jgi:hypothetical protein
MTRRLVAPGVALALAAAGCGGGGQKAAGHGAGRRPAAPAAARVDPRYRTAVTRIADDFAAAGRQLKDAISAQPGAAGAAAALIAYQSRLRTDAERLAGLRPPAALLAAHRRLTGGLRAIAAGAQPAVDAGQAGDAATLQRAFRRLQDRLDGALGARIRAAADRLDAGLAGG